MTCSCFPQNIFYKISFPIRHVAEDLPSAACQLSFLPDLKASSPQALSLSSPHTRWRENLWGKVGEIFTPCIVLEEPKISVGPHSQPAGVSVWALKFCMQGEKTAGSLSHLSRDKATIAGETAAFGRLSRGYRRNRGGANWELVWVLDRFIKGSENSGLRDAPSGPGLIVAWVYTDFHHW